MLWRLSWPGRDYVCICTLSSRASAAGVTCRRIAGIQLFDLHGRVLDLQPLPQPLVDQLRYAIARTPGATQACRVMVGRSPVIDQTWIWWTSTTPWNVTDQFGLDVFDIESVRDTLQEHIGRLAGERSMRSEG